jgi:hypothetical protein
MDKKLEFKWMKQTNFIDGTSVMKSFNHETFITQRQFERNGYEKANTLNGCNVLLLNCSQWRKVRSIAKKVGKSGFLVVANKTKKDDLIINLLMQTMSLHNVIPLQWKSYTLRLESKIFHQIISINDLERLEFPDLWLIELHRLLHPSGTLIIGRGRLTKSEAKQKIYNSGIWDITLEDSHCFYCSPV